MYKEKPTPKKGVNEFQTQWLLLNWIDQLQMIFFEKRWVHRTVGNNFKTKRVTQDWSSQKCSQLQKNVAIKIY